MSVKVTLSPRYAQALRLVADMALAGQIPGDLRADLAPAKARLDRAMTKHRVPLTKEGA